MSTKPLRGGDALTTKQIREQLVELNNAFDGPGEVVIGMSGEDTECRVRYADVEFGDEVVTLPGDGKPFPVSAYVNALRASLVRVS